MGDERSGAGKGAKILSVMVAMLFAASAFAVVLSAAGPDNDVGPNGFLGEEGGQILFQNFYGTEADEGFYGVTAVAGGFVAVGGRNGDPDAVLDFGNEQIGSSVAVVVMFDDQLQVVWDVVYDESGFDLFFGVTTTPDGNVVAVGYSAVELADNEYSVNALIVKYDISDGSVLWERTFGGGEIDMFVGVAIMNNGDIVAVGSSTEGSFLNGDWEFHDDRFGMRDATLVVFEDNDTFSTVAWFTSFGGEGDDEFRGVAVLENGNIVAVGYSDYESFLPDQNSSWQRRYSDNAPTGYGGRDAIAVMFDATSSDTYGPGIVLDAGNFGGAGDDEFNGVTAGDGFVIAVGYSDYESFDNGTAGKRYQGSWEDVCGFGMKDAIAVKIFTDYDGEIPAGTMYGANFGGPRDDAFYGVTLASDGNVIAVGTSVIGANSNIQGTKGMIDGIAVKYDVTYGVELAFGHFGGAGMNWFAGVVAGEEFIVAVGMMGEDCFGTGDWADFPAGEGGTDQIIMMIGSYTDPFEPAPPAITTTSLPNGKVGVAYNQTVAADGAPVPNLSISVGSLPDGLTISKAGVISGTPTTAGTFTFTVKAWNVVGEDTKEFTVVIAPASGGDGDGGKNMWLWIGLAAIAIIAIVAVLYFFVLKKKT